MTDELDRYEQDRYEQEVGKPPENLPEDHPYRWQWDYRGTKEDRERLAELLGEPEEIEGQDALFDA